MTDKIAITSDRAPPPVGPYSQAVKVDKFLYISGQIPFDINKGEIVYGDIKEATKVVLENIKAILEEANYSLDDVVKCSVFLKDMDNFTQMNEVYSQYFTGDVTPAREAVEVAKLPKNVDVEISAIAWKEM